MRPKIRATLFASTKNYLVTYITIYLLFSILLLTPVWLAQTDEYTLESFNAPQNSSLWVLFYLENTFGFDFGMKTTRNLIVFITILGIQLSIYLFSVVLLNVSARISLKKTNGIISPNVMNLQKMLYKSFCMQAIFSLSAFFIPIIIVAIVLLSNLPPIFHYFVGMVFVMMISCYAPIGALMAILTIKPYRVYLFSIVCKKMHINPKVTNIIKVKSLFP